MLGSFGEIGMHHGTVESIWMGNVYSWFNKHYEQTFLLDR